MSTYFKFTTTLIWIALLSHSDTSSLKTDGSYICELPPSRGYCKGKGTTRYFYNINTHKCETFTYSGCNGNYNNFEDFQSCNEFCNKASFTTLHPIPTNTCCECITPTPFISGCSHDITCQTIVCNLDEACCNNDVGWDKLCSSDAENICLQTMNDHTPNPSASVNPTSFPTSYPIINEISTTSEINKSSALPTTNPTESILITDTVSTTQQTNELTSTTSALPTVSNRFSTSSPTSDGIFTTSKNPIISTTVNPIESIITTTDTESISTTDGKITTSASSHVDTTIAPTTQQTTSILPTTATDNTEFKSTTVTTIHGISTTQKTEHSTTSDVIFGTSNSETNKLTPSPNVDTTIASTQQTESTDGTTTVHTIQTTNVGISTTKKASATSTSRLIATVNSTVHSIPFRDPLLPDDIETSVPMLITDINEGTTNSTLENTMESTNSDTEKGMDDVKQAYTMKSIDRTKGGTIAVCLIGGLSCVFCVLIILHYTKFRSNEKKKRAMQDFDHSDQLPHSIDIGKHDLEQNSELNDL